MLSRVRLLLGSRYVRNIAAVLGGSAGGQLIVLASMPVLTRLYAPSSFAISQSIGALVVALSVVACLRYEMALASGDRDDLGGVVALCLTLLIPAALLAIGFGAVLGAFGLWRSVRGLSDAAVWALPIGLVFTLLASGGSHLLIRSGGFAALARGKLLQALAFAASALAIGLLAPRSTGVMIADLAGRGALALCLCVPAAAWLRSHAVALHPRALLSLAAKYRRFPLYGVPGGLLNVLGGSFNTLWMLSLFDAHAAGSYALVERAVAAPVTLVAASVAQAFQGRLVTHLSEGSAGMADDFLRLLRVQLALGLALAIGLAAVSPIAFPLVFGGQWDQAGAFAQVFGLYVASSFVTFPFNIGLVVLGRQKQQLAWELSWFILLNGAWAAAWALKAPPLTALALVTAGGVAANALFLLRLYRQLRRQDALAAA